MKAYLVLANDSSEFIERRYFLKFLGNTFGSKTLKMKTVHL